MENYTTVIGLEVHIQLNTSSKAFSSDPNKFGSDPNENISAITLALPGTLPVLNHTQLNSAIKLALALNSSINLESRFDRKNYFYPDLPKGYQITQENLPICVAGALNYFSEGKNKTVRIHHVHMEEDAGKSMHNLNTTLSRVDYNRAGTPLLEIVTEPDFRSAQEVHDFIAALQLLVRYLDISDGNMDEGSLRCDVNVSVMKKGSKTYGERCEVKNVNSKKFAKQAVISESARQIKILEDGGKIEMNTLLFNPKNGTTHPMRSKEGANDYRYLPDPDLPPVVITQEYISHIESQITLLPWTAVELLTTKYNLSNYDAEIIARDKKTVQYFLAIIIPDNSYPTLANLIINKILPYINEKETAIASISRKNVASFVKLLDSGRVSKSNLLNTLSTILLDARLDTLDFKKLAHQYNLIESEDQDFLNDAISEVLNNNIDKIKAYKNGKTGLKGFFIGQVMRVSQGKANPQKLDKKMTEALNKWTE
ncbi:MAG: Asp-tRNA(Asn)/Glu-tRNA(Gln) amidotransferase subunit GatB [Saprospiraceae bacterium]